MHKNSIIFLSIIIFLSGIFGCSSKNPHKELTAKINEYMNRLSDTGFSGALLVAKGGDVVISKGYGLANREKKIPITDETVFTIGSITKQFTGAAILKLQMQRKLSVQDPISKYFENVPEDKQGITLHHLLTHTAGFPGAIGDDFQVITRDEFIKLAMQTKLNHDPGTAYEYSNVGFSLLGAIIEIISGETYEKYLHENLFEPAGMKQTGYRIPDWKTDKLAHGYRGQKDWGTLLDHPWAEDGPYWNLRANGGILSTVKDMYKWHLALLDNKILSDEAKQLYFTPHVREGEDADSFYGYGWVVMETDRGTKLITHNGGNMIFAADMRRYVDEDVVIIAMSNTAGKPAWRATSTVAQIVFGYDYELPAENVETISIDELKKMPTGQRALALLEMYASNDEKSIDLFINEHLHTGFIERATRDRLYKIFKQDQEGIGKAKIRKVVKANENGLELTVQSEKTGEWWQITLRFEEAEPYRILQMRIVDTVPEE